MVGIFRRFYNHQGELRWKFVTVSRNVKVDHAEVVCRHALYPELHVLCNIKRAPRVGTYCKPPASYM